ncbi:stalk domain-containing protein [Paenibacillus tarimensis]|uniref:stalk domain-containing protein n=1 Tax=Paenibacillus tarimensis TaxID=416012 RepID=UPI001EEB365F|nr:stalk domain-containing protein [Paenibacillus tarimensis]MCF2944137.1 phosphodiester glycosidase family protein [Paenibacillus tarimensis]
MHRLKYHSSGNGQLRPGKRKKAAKTLLVLALGSALLVQPGASGLMAGTGITLGGTAAAAVGNEQLKLLAENIITSGAVRKDYKWTSVRSGETDTANIHVIEVDLTNPHVQLNAMNGNSSLPGKSTVMKMAKDTGAVAGINADFFDTGSSEAVPFGAQITSGKLVKSPKRIQGMYMFAVTADKVPMVDQFTFEGTVTAANGAAFPLTGINESSYRMAPDNAYSHANALYIYTSSWTAAQRPNTVLSATSPTEVLVQNGIVTQIADNASLAANAPADGYILRAHGTAAKFVRENLTVGSPVQSDYQLKSVTTGKSYTESAFQFMVGGHTILVNEGKAASYSRSVSGISPNSDRARTAAGYSRDGKKAYLITVEDFGSSKGMTLSELQSVMVKLGVWKGVNLDGGGSTTMVDRPLGEFNIKLSHPTEDNSGGTYQRPVVNGIGVYTLAPKGSVKGITASGKQTLFIGEQAAYSVKAYDTYYNPVDPSGITASWSIDKTGVAKVNNGTVTGIKPGEANLTVKSGTGSSKLPIEVVGEAKINKLTINASSTVLNAGSSVQVPVTAVLEDGKAYHVPAASLKWELIGFTGSVKDGILTVDTVKPETKAGYAIARYDGYSAVLVMSAGGTTDQRLEDFEKVSYGITTSGTPAGVKGSVQLVTGYSGRETSKVLKFSYDFQGSTENKTKAAYAVLNSSGGGIPLAGTPNGFSLDVYGDAGRNWLRATLVDANGKEHLVTLADAISWTGWKTVKAAFPSTGIAYPVKLKNLYVVTLAEGQDEREPSGELAFDNINVQYPVTAAPSKAKVILKLGSKSATVNGEKVKLDVAPIALKGVTYLPLRFVADTMGGQVDWDQPAKRATAIRGDRMLDMWLGKKAFVINGVRNEADQSPIVRDGRTLVPVRLVSEQLGMSVKWEGTTKTITIQ